MWIKCILGWLICFAIILVPLQPYSIFIGGFPLGDAHPMIAILMPFAEKLGVLGSAIYTLIYSISFFAIWRPDLPNWIFVQGFAYAVVLALAALLLKKNKVKILGYVLYAFIGSILFDIIYRVPVGPLQYGQPILSALKEQMPYTFMRAIINTIYALILSFPIYRWIVMNPRLESDAIFRRKKK